MRNKSIKYFRKIRLAVPKTVKVEGKTFKQRYKRVGLQSKPSQNGKGLNQKGGMFPLGLLAPVATGLVGSLIDKNF